MVNVRGKTYESKISLNIEWCSLLLFVSISDVSSFCSGFLKRKKNDKQYEMHGFFNIPVFLQTNFVFNLAEILRPSKNWVLFSNREKGVAKRIFFWKMSVDNPFEIHNHFSHLHQALNDCVWLQEDSFRSLRSAKKLTSFDDIKKIPKVCILLDSEGDHLNRINWIISKFDIEILHTYGHVTTVFKIFE